MDTREQRSGSLDHQGRAGRKWTAPRLFLNFILVALVTAAVVYAVRQWWPDSYERLQEWNARWLSSLCLSLGACASGRLWILGEWVFIGLLLTETFLAFSLLRFLVLPGAAYVLRTWMPRFGLWTFLLANICSLAYIAIMVLTPTQPDIAEFARTWQLAIITIFTLTRLLELMGRHPLDHWQAATDYGVGFVAQLVGVYLVGHDGAGRPLPTLTFFAILAPVVEYYQLLYLFRAEKSRDEK